MARGPRTVEPIHLVCFSSPFLSTVPTNIRIFTLVYWSNIEVTNYVAPPANNTRTLGKQLEIDVIGGLPARVPGEVFKHIQHGEEWYYCFNNQAFLLALINYLENNKIAGQDFVRFANTNAAKVAIEQWFRTA